MSTTGNFVQFGGYYQSKVTDETLISTLTAKTGELPTDEDDKTWTSYKYYSSPSINDILVKNEIDFMWYQDITEGEDKYRAVYYSHYRTNDGQFDSYTVLDPTKDISNTEQDNNGYKKGFVYFFKYEPITWEIITVRKDGTAMLFTKNIMDAQPFHHVGAAGSAVKSNNYEHSDIRNWLNGYFYGAAFSEAEKEIIQTTTVDNSAASTCVVKDKEGFSVDITPYVCNNTQDKVFFLSMAELCDTALFPDEGGPSTNKKPTDYALMQGLENRKIGSFYNNYWMTRSPLPYNGYVQKTSFPDVRPYATYFISYVKSGGVVPTINVRL